MSDTVIKAESLGVYSVYGPNWTRNLKTICDNLTSLECYGYTVGTTTMKPMSMKAVQHWSMNRVTRRFQEYADKWSEGKTEMPLVSLESIKKVPITMFIGTLDTICPHKTAVEHIPRIGSSTKRIDVEGASHLYFSTVANSDWFMSNLNE